MDAWGRRELALAYVGLSAERGGRQEPGRPSEHDCGGVEDGPGMGSARARHARDRELAASGCTPGPRGRRHLRVHMGSRGEGEIYRLYMLNRLEGRASPLM